METISKILDIMTKDYENNVLILKNIFASNAIIADDFLHGIVSKKYDEKKALLAIGTLLKSKLVHTNCIFEDGTGYNFIQRAMRTGYSSDFIIDITNLAHDAPVSLDAMHKDSAGNSLIHSAIRSDVFNNFRLPVYYDTLCRCGMDPKVTDRDGLNVIDAIDEEMSENHKYGPSFVNMMNLISNRYHEDVKPTTKKEATTTSKSQTKEKNGNGVAKKTSNTKKKIELPLNVIEVLNRKGTLLNTKKYTTAPTIGREKEMEKLMVALAQEKKNPIIVGESGVGKTAIVDELAYRISKDEVPSFLKDQIILEINPSSVVAGCKYVGEFEKSMQELMDLTIKYKIILFIDEIHTIYGLGAGEHKNNDMAAVLKHYIDRDEVRVIGTTTENEYQEFFAHDALKRRFEKINVKEPDNDTLRIILNKVLEDYCKKNKTKFENETDQEQIVKTLLYATKEHSRVYNDKVNNPDLSISIIDKAFAYLKVSDEKKISKRHFAKAFESCDRLYSTSNEEAIRSLNIEVKAKPKTTKIVNVDFTKGRR